MTDTKDIEYIPYSVFISRYPMEANYSSEGSYGKIYFSKDIYAIKKFRCIPQLNDIIIELNAYSSLIHPCILRPLAWTAKDSIAYLAMDKGEDIIEAYNNGKITIEQIICDSLSAIEYMNGEGYAHADIKPSNMIYHEDKCKIIDMGLVRKTTIHHNGRHYFNGTAYVSNYRDPEYYSEQYNPVEVEIYALCSSYKHIYEGKTPHFGSLDNYRTGESHIDWLFEKAELPVTCRPSIHLLLLDLPLKTKVRSYNGIPFKEPKVNSEYNIILAFAMRWIAIKSCSFNVKSRSLFLCLHLMHRVFSLINNDESTPLLFACCCFNVALMCITNNTFSILYWKKISDDNRENYASLFEHMTMEILIAAKGIIICANYWDYAMGAEDLIPLLYDIINKDYNPCLIREVEGELNKNILLLKVGSLLPKNKESKSMKKKISIIYPSNLYIGDDIVHIHMCWNKPEFDICDGIGVLLRNKSVLKSISLTLVLRICKTIHSSRYDVLFFNRVCPFDWRNKLSEMFISNTNPFLIN